eukprot:TRINITY_DN11236_c0_g1_i1.p1 TRINITY_DN11236_c0_g1~~TRINITY_DN11236_c0_g1_i1.p1  ORF type:complete len:158 (+),score=21.40 TRINITY_DN11236_c0_g1_i1:78-551(+)
MAGNVPNQYLLRKQFPALKKPKHQVFDSADWMLEINRIRNSEPSVSNQEVEPTTVLVKETLPSFSDEEIEEPRVEPSRSHVFRALREKPGRKYFDSADWAQTADKSVVPVKLMKINQPKAVVVMFQKKDHSRKYFDSADWASDASYVPQIHPHLTVV